MSNKKPGHHAPGFFYLPASEIGQRCAHQRAILLILLRSFIDLRPGGKRKGVAGIVRDGLAFFTFAIKIIQVIHFN
ncbi:hypothetical protein [Kosakonia cowanii]|uniref:hypothetical protein n=1 Tax=Kosakonia cowanii TaxID=208223 RepID=UPI004064408B